jgi:hypothetical protein
MRPTVPEEWKPRLRAYLRERHGEDRETLSASDFPSGQSVRIGFPDGSSVLFHHAFALMDESRGEVAVFTEHCGYHVFPSADAEIEVLDSASAGGGLSFRPGQHKERSMADDAALVRDDQYDDLGRAYQSILASFLDKALLDNGVSDPAVRREVCGSFMFAWGAFHDQRWFKASFFQTPDEKVYPLLCFTKRFLDVDTPVEDVEPVLVPSVISFIESAGGAVESYFDEDVMSQITLGYVADPQ